MSLDSEHETAMVHYECFSCGMTATCVVTGATNEAWAHHMTSHEDTTGYGSWTWSVFRLPGVDG